MKQLKIILLIFVFSYSKIGMALNFHYCGNHLAKISLAYNPKGCGMEATPIETSKEAAFSQKNCCGNDLEVFQNLEDMNFSSDLDYSLVFALPIIIQSNHSQKLRFSLKDIQLNKRPPPLKNLAFYILHNSFIFYD